MRQLLPHRTCAWGVDGLETPGSGLEQGRTHGPSSRHPAMTAQAPEQQWRLHRNWLSTRRATVSTVVRLPDPKQAKPHPFVTRRSRPTQASMKSAPVSPCPCVTHVEVSTSRARARFSAFNETHTRGLGMTLRPDTLAPRVRLAPSLLSNDTPFTKRAQLHISSKIRLTLHLRVQSSPTHLFVFFSFLDLLRCPRPYTASLIFRA